VEIILKSVVAMNHKTAPNYNIRLNINDMELGDLCKEEKDVVFKDSNKLLKCDFCMNF
jgi:hypothetical protein